MSAEAPQPDAMTAMTVMIVEDDPDVRLGCEQALRLEGMATRGVPSAEAALREVQAGYAGIVVSDIHLPGADGMALLRELMTRDAALPVIMITGHGDVSLAVQAMKQGAYDFLEKPFSPERLVATCRRALDKRRLALEVAELRARLAGRETLSARLIGDSPAIGRLRQMIADLADTAANVLIHGETGTGRLEPSRSTTRSCSTRSSLICIGMGMLSISSRNSVPPSACSILPMRRRAAPVNEPASWPKISDSNSCSGRPPQLIGTKWRARRPLASCRQRATSSLPVPVSP